MINLTGIRRDFLKLQFLLREHKILNAKEGWRLSNKLHGQLVPEDTILQELINAGYIAG
jgi:hypothetical protein